MHFRKSQKVVNLSTLMYPCRPACASDVRGLAQKKYHCICSAVTGSDFMRIFSFFGIVCKHFTFITSKKHFTEIITIILNKHVNVIKDKQTFYVQYICDWGNVAQKTVWGMLGSNPEISQSVITVLTKLLVRKFSGPKIILHCPPKKTEFQHKNQA